ncbi:MAG: MFS transporter [Campylobacteraceae bacterium]|nr:MFS transporter [Campylobacteraceae bacterium]
MLVFAISLQALPPIFSSIMEDIPFSNSQAGFLMSSYAVLGIFLPFFAILFLDKLNLKKMLIVALILVLTGLAGFALSSSYISFLGYRLLSGAGATILIVLSPLLVTIYFNKNNIGTAMGIFNIAVPVGTVLSVNLFGYLGLFMSWRSSIGVIIGFVCLVLLAVIFFLILPANKTKMPNSSKLELNLGSSLIFLAIIWMIANAQLLAYITFGPSFFQLHGMSVQEAGFFTSVIMLVSIFLTPIIGIMIDRTGQKKIYLFLGLLIMTVSFFAIALSWFSLALWAITLGIGFSFVPVVVFSLLPNVVKPEHTGMGLAAITSASNLGIAIGAAGFGTILDLTSGNFNIGFQALSIFSILGIFILFRVNKTINY